MILKYKPLRSQAYLKFVDSLPSVVSGKLGCMHHHVIDCGLGGTMGGKASDLFVFPLTPEEHNDLHSSVAIWENSYGSQEHYVLRTLMKAEADGWRWLPPEV